MRCSNTSNLLKFDKFILNSKYLYMYIHVTFSINTSNLKLNASFFLTLDFNNNIYKSKEWQYLSLVRICPYITTSICPSFPLIILYTFSVTTSNRFTVRYVKSSKTLHRTWHEFWVLWGMSRYMSMTIGNWLLEPVRVFSSAIL